jgi:hypothetical protein
MKSVTKIEFGKAIFKAILEKKEIKNVNYQQEIYELEISIFRVEVEIYLRKLEDCFSKNMDTISKIKSAFFEYITLNKVNLTQEMTIKFNQFIENYELCYNNS